MMQLPLPGLEDLACGTAGSVREEGRMTMDSAEGTTSSGSGAEDGGGRSAITDPGAGGRAADSARQSNPPAGDHGQRGGRSAEGRRQRSPRARDGSGGALTQGADDEEITAMIDSWPPLSEQERERLAQLLR